MDKKLSFGGFEVMRFVADLLVAMVFNVSVLGFVVTFPFNG